MNVDELEYQNLLRLINTTSITEHMPDSVTLSGKTLQEFQVLQESLKNCIDALGQVLGGSAVIHKLAAIAGGLEMCVNSGAADIVHKIAMLGEKLGKTPADINRDINDVMEQMNKQDAQEDK